MVRIQIKQNWFWVDDYWNWVTDAWGFLKLSCLVLRLIKIFYSKEFPLWLNGISTFPLSVRTQVQSPAQCSGVKDPCCPKCTSDLIPGPGIPYVTGQPKKKKKKCFYNKYTHTHKHIYLHTIIALRKTNQFNVIKFHWSSRRGSVETKLGTMRLRVWSLASCSGLRIQHCCEPWCRSQMRLGSGIAVALA